jgi:hypothetical protein
MYGVMVEVTEACQLETPVRQGCDWVPACVGESGSKILGDDWCHCTRDAIPEWRVNCLCSNFDHASRSIPESSD